jgi:hypothetical protein
MSAPQTGSGHEEHWTERPQRCTRIQQVAPLSLLAEGNNVLVRAEFRRTRRRRWLLTAACVGAPLALFVLARVIGGESEDPSAWSFRYSAESWVRLGVVTFVSFWPLAMFLGAVLSTATAVLSDRTEETAFQVVLTPVSGEAIAAARILPRVRPFLWGVLAAAPLYFWAGSAEVLSFGGRGLSPLAFWPFRMVAPFLWNAGGMETSGAGVIAGIFMVPADAGMVWAGAHWGACYAVWLGSLPGTMLYLAWRLFYISVTFILWCLLTLILVGLGLGGLAAFLQGALLLGILYRFPWREAVRMALEEFSRYDRLCDDEFRAGYFKRFSLRAPGRGETRP